MQNNQRKLLALLTKAMATGLALLMAESNALAVSANDGDASTPSIIITSAQELKDAVTSGTEDVSLILDADIDYDQSAFGTLTITKNIRIDCGDYKISLKMDWNASDDGVISIGKGASLTLVNAEISQSDKSMIGVNDGTFVIESTKGTGISANCVVANNNGKVIVKNGSFNLSEFFVDECPGSIEIMNGVFRSKQYLFDSISGRLIIHQADAIAEGGSCIYVDEEGEADIFGGTFTSAYNCISNYGKTILHPGTSFESTTDGWNALYSDEGTYYVSEDGYPTVPMENWDNAAKVEILSKKSLEKTSISVQVNWIGKEAEKTEIWLLADGAKNQNITLSNANAWAASFTDLPKYGGEDEHEIAYWVVPSAIAGYDSQVSGNAKDGFTITYTVAGKASFPVSVVWKGGTGERTIVHLLADGAEAAKQELNAGNQWNFTFADYDRYSAGHEINYTLSVDNVPGYSTEVTWVTGEGFIVTNTRIQPSSENSVTPSGGIPSGKSIVPQTGAHK